MPSTGTEGKMVKRDQGKSNCLDESTLEIKIFIFSGNMDYSDMILGENGTISISVLT